jgi:alanyl-tRNA synthetase
VERLVNEQVVKNQELGITFSSYDDAIREGVMALFGEKYDDEVRRIRVADFSEELCGGTHVRRTGDIGAFVILTEAGIAAGVRRIEAQSGAGALAIHQKDRRVIDAMRRQLQATPEDLPQRIQTLQDDLQKLKKENTNLRSRGSHDDLAGLWEGVEDRARGKLLVRHVVLESADGIREMGDRLRSKLGSGVALLAVQAGEKTTLLCVVTDDLIGLGIKADAIVREAAQLAGGSGGGRPHLAMAGIGDPALTSKVLDEMRTRLSERLG